MKTRNDYRIEAYVYGDASGRPYWYAQGDTNTGSGAYNQHFWSASNKSIPVPLDHGLCRNSIFTAAPEAMVVFTGR